MINNIERKLNLGILGLGVVLSVSLVMLGSGATVSAAPATTPKSIHSWMDDNCYSTPATASSLASGIPSPFSAGDNLIGKFGLVNAIVRVPIYDWDQNPPLAPDPLSDSIGPRFSAPSVKPIGYVERFTGTVTPVPNVRWMQEYATKQAPHDLGMLATLVNPTMNNPVPLPDPSIANPLLYQRTSIIDKHGVPNITFSNPDFQDRTATSNPGELTPENLEDMGDALNGGGVGSVIGDNVDPEEIEAIKNDPDAYNNETAGSGFGLTGARFSVNKDNPADNCYEYLDTNAKKVPAYAFSVPKFGLPITYFGSFFSVITMFANKGPSFSGATFYPASANGKMMLDCYGRGITPTLVPSGTSIGNYKFTGILGAPNIFKWEDLLKSAVMVLDGAITNGAALTNPAAWVLQRLPMPKLHRENYFNGMAYLFNIDSVQPDDLPGALRGREIDVFKNVSVNARTLTHYDGGRADNGGHEASNNGSTYFPNLYIKLKKPYNHTPSVQTSNITPDGKSFTVEPKIKKEGYTKSPYNNTGGNKNAPARDGWAKARIIETIFKPGHVPSTSEPRSTDYSAGQLPGGANSNLGEDELCNFLTSKAGGDEAVEDCSQYSEVALNKSLLGEEEDHTATKTIASISRKIPAETPPGTKYCYTIYLNQKDNDLKFEGVDYYNPEANAGYHAERDKRYLSRTYCVISGYKPSLQVRGGDLMVDGDVNTETNRKDFLRSATPGPMQQRTYGSWAEYGLFATGNVSGARMGSGAKYRVGQANPSDSFDPHGYLTFGNHYDESGDANFGNFKAPGGNMNDGFDKIEAFFLGRQANAMPSSEMPSSCKSNSNVITLKNCASGDYFLADGGTFTIDGEDFKDDEDGKSLVFFVGENTTVTLKNDLETRNDYEQPADISQVVFTPAQEGDGYLVNIHQDAKRVDAWIVNPHGSINTCFTGSYVTDTPRSKLSGTTSHPCYDNRLVVNGPVAAQHLFLRRSGGIDQNQTPPYTPVHQSQPGELFNLRPDAYLWAQNQVSSGGGKFTTVQTIDLPPRY